MKDHVFVTSRIVWIAKEKLSVNNVLSQPLPQSSHSQDVVLKLFHFLNVMLTTVKTVKLLHLAQNVVLDIPSLLKEPVPKIPVQKTQTVCYVIFLTISVSCAEKEQFKMNCLDKSVLP